MLDLFGQPHLTELYTSAIKLNYLILNMALSYFNNFSSTEYGKMIIDIAIYLNTSENKSDH